MMPIAPLMIEHRLIERLIARLGVEAERVRVGQPVDPNFVERAVDFIRSYADRCHHGKEEDILFRDLAAKSLSPEHARVMQELADEHVQARGLVRALIEAKDRFVRGEPGATRDVADLLERIAVFYPPHIEKEDRHFFVPVMVYFSKEDQAAMLAQFEEFDRRLVHERYRQVVEELGG
jgi:hemerythrin-like domain-containing protein